MKISKRFGKKILSFVLMLAILMSVAVTGFVSVSAASTSAEQVGAAESGDMRTIYFSPNGYWNNLFAVYLWTEGTGASEWKMLNKVDGVDGLWSVEFSSTYTHATFCSRLYPAYTETAIDNKTGELKLQDGFNYLSLTDVSTSVWGYYSEDNIPDDVTGTQKVYFSPCADWVYIQNNLYHDFIVRAWSDVNTEGVLVQCELIEGDIAAYPNVWVAEIPANYDNVEFLRAESTVENGWYVWEKTEEQTIPADSNLFTQYADAQTGTWSYYTAPEEEPDNGDDNEDPAPENPGYDGELQTVYFAPNAMWLSYVNESGGNISVAYKIGDSDYVWAFAALVAEGVYSANVPAQDASVVFAVSFGETADLVWEKTELQTVPAGKDYFVQDDNNTQTGTWSVYRAGVTGVYYSVAFVDWNGTLLSAQAVIEGGSATAPAAPERENDSQYKYTFKGWDKSFTNVNSDMIVTAVYDRTALPPVAAATTGKLRLELAGGSNFTISVNGGNARPQGASYVNTKMPVGTEVTVVADTTNGLEFLGWMNEAGAVVSKTETFEFYTTGNDYYKAVYQTEVEGVNIVLFKNSRALGGNGQIFDMQYYAAGDEIIFPDAPTLTGYNFVAWNYTEAEIQAKLEAGENVVVDATWEIAKTYVDVTVNGGTVSTVAEPNGQYLAFNAVAVVANNAPAGQKFAYWADAEGNIASYKATYKFYPAADVELTAVFVAEDAAVELKPILTLSANPLNAPNEEKITYILSWDVDASIGTVTGVGVIIVDKADYKEETFVHGTTDGNVFDRAFANKVAQSGEYAPNKSASYYDHTYVAAMWIQYTDANTGDTVTIYSANIEVYKPAP